MNFSFKNITKDTFLTVLGVILSLLVLFFTLLLVWKDKVDIEKAQNFLSVILPILIGFFSLAGRNKTE